VAERLARGGAIIAGIDMDSGALEAAMSGLTDKGASAVALPADVTDRAAVERVFSDVESRFGRLDALVNCAGVTGRTGIRAHEVDPDDFARVCLINLHAAMLLTRSAVPLMLARNYGRILHVASIAGKEGNAGMLAYSASKAGLIGLVKSAAKDYAETGITINALAPAVIRTDMVAAMPEQQVRYMTDKIPMKRTGKLEEAAAMIEFIVSPDCAFTTGFTFDLSGGRATY
jgi:3-oxoacyl-[acyl-carrier protein] reductase